MRSRVEELDALIPPVEPAWMSDATVSAPARKVLPLRPSGLTALSWADVMAEPAEPPPMLAPGIPKVGLTVLAGPPKVGKTLYASQTALQAGRTTIVIEEGSMAGISFRLRKQSRELGIDNPDLEVLHRQRIRLDDRTSVMRLREHLTARRPVLVLFDPLNRLHNGDENRPSQMTPVMDALAGIAYDFDCAVLAIHHLAKPSQERRGDIWDRFRGATSIRSGTDANLIMDGSGATVRLYGEFRDAEPMSEYLELDRDTLLFSRADGPASAGKVDLEELATFIREGAGRATASAIAARFSCTAKTARTAIENLDGVTWTEGPRGTRLYALHD
jgi:AAA domain-containing protein